MASDVRLRSLSVLLHGEPDTLEEMHPPAWVFSASSELSERGGKILSRVLAEAEWPDEVEPVFDLSVSMEAQFQWTARGALDPHQFARLNAVAFIWPYVREVIWATTTRVGLPPLILPMVNLTEAVVTVVDA